MLIVGKKKGGDKGDDGNGWAVLGQKWTKVKTNRKKTDREKGWVLAIKERRRKETKRHVAIVQTQVTKRERDQFPQGVTCTP